MCEETQSEFIEELIKRGEAVPRDLIEKYREKGVPPSDLAASILARDALNRPDPPASALENSGRRVSEAVEQARDKQSQPVSHARMSLGARLLAIARRLLRMRDG